MDVISEIQTHRRAHCGMKDSLTLQTQEDVKDETPESSPRGRARQINVGIQENSALEIETETKFGGESAMELDSISETRFRGASAREAESLPQTKFGGAFATEVKALPEKQPGTSATEIEDVPETKLGAASTKGMETRLQIKSGETSTKNDKGPLQTEFEESSAKEPDSALDTKSEEASEKRIESPLQAKFGGATVMGIDVSSERKSSSLIISRDSKETISEKEEELISAQIVSLDSKENASIFEEDGELGFEVARGGTLPQRDLNENNKSTAAFVAASSSGSLDSLEIVSEDSEGDSMEKDEGDLGFKEPLSQTSPQSELDKNAERKAVIGEGSSSAALDSKFTMTGPTSVPPLTSNPTLKKESSSKSLDSRLPPRKESSSGSLDSKLTTSVMRRKKQLSVTVFERMQQDPLLAEHFAQLETPTAEPVQDCHSPGFGPRRSLKSTRRLKCTTDSVGVKYLNQYIVIKVLGRGAFGKVKLCLNTMDCKLYAVKILHRKWVARQSIGGTRDDVGKGALREIAIMKKLHHPNVVALVEVIDDPTNRKLYLVLEYVEGGPIMENDRWHPIAEEKARRYFRDMCQGLDYLHFNKIVHRDLKPGNLLQTMDGRIKISDFGVSHMLDHESDSIHGTAGTPAFLAPEICSGGECQGRAADIWALGVCLYVIVYGQIPFPAETVVDMYKCIINKKSLILTKDPNSRISLAGILQHDWVSNFGTQPLIPLKLQKTGVSRSREVSEDEVKAAVKQVGLAALSTVEPVEKHFEPGEYIMRQGEEGQEMYLITSGECEVLVESRSLAHPSRGRMEYAIAERGPGQYIGEMALSTDTTKKPPKRTASIRAKTHVVTLVVSRDQVMEVLSKNSEAAKNIADTIAERDREMRRRMRALELRLPSFRPSSFTHANEQGNTHLIGEGSTKVSVLKNEMPNRNPMRDENKAKGADICWGCRIL